jgi:YHS domain-containing protein
MLRHTALAFVLVAAPVLAPLFALAQDQRTPPIDPARAVSNLDGKHLAIGGFDPVAYFPAGGGEPTKGSKDVTAVYRGATYRFASAAHRDLFLASPSEFAPAYGGWCAYAMASGERVEVDPESFLIEDGSLLLFYDGLFADTRKSWGKEGPDALRAKADAAWLASAREPRLRDLAEFAHVDGLALGGHDPVAYHSEGDAPKVVLGSDKIATRERGLTYRFASADNRLAFLAHPAHFEPAFGGFDALALANGAVAAGAAQHFGFTSDGRLVLFAAPADGAEASGVVWERERPRLEPLAEATWKAHLERLAAEREKSRR